MKAQEQKQKSIENMMKINEAAHQKEMMNEYKSAISHKKQLMGVEKDIDHHQAKNMKYNRELNSLNLEMTARQSLYKETSQRKEVLNKFKDDLKNDYAKRYETFI